MFGWGSRYDDRLLDRLAAALAGAEERRLDRWDVDVRRSETGSPHVETLTTRVGVQPDVSSIVGLAPARGAGSAESVSRVTLHNYLGVGVDAKAALAFHEAREANPGWFVSSVTNKFLYGVFGAVDFVTHSCRALLRDKVSVVADGVDVPIPRNAEGIIVLNLNSYAGGARMWDAGARGTHRTNVLFAALSGGVQDTRFDDDDDEAFAEDGGDDASRESGRAAPFGRSARDDGLVDVVAVYGALHLGQLSLGTDRPVRLTQARSVRIEVRDAFPVHVDGQPWAESRGATIAITRRDRVAVLAADPKSLTACGSGRGYEAAADQGSSAETSRTFLGWESWEDPEYYDDLETAPHACVRSMLD